MVCVGGYSVGGGLALTSRMLGLNTDAVIEFRVVDANGDLLVANENEHSDLYWGLRGGSGINLGIVVSLLFQGTTMPSQILGGHLSFDMRPDAAEAMAGTMYDLIWGAGDPEENRPFGFSMAWVPSDDDPNGRTDLKLMGLWLSDDIARGRIILEQFKANPGFRTDNVTQGTFQEVMQPLMDQYLGLRSLNWTMPDAMIAPPKSRAEFSAFAATVTVAARQKPAGSMIAWVFAPLGGKVNDVASDHTAFPHRSSGGNFHMPTIWFSPTLAEPVRAFGQDSLHLTKTWWVPSVNRSTSDPSSYVNHPSEYLEDYQSAYWMGNLPRLQQVKRKYDPRNFLSNGQGIIGVDGGGPSSSGLSNGSIYAIAISCIVGVLLIGYVTKVVIARRRSRSDHHQSYQMMGR